jgi:hypothetical protein
MAISDDRHIASAKKQYQAASERLALSEVALKEAKTEHDTADRLHRQARATWESAVEAYLRRND